MLRIKGTSLHQTLVLVQQTTSQLCGPGDQALLGLSIQEQFYLKLQ